MRSPFNFWASVAFLLAVPVAALTQALFGFDAATVLHFDLFVGFCLLTAYGFNTPIGFTLPGLVSIWVLWLTFLFQSVALATGNESINWLGFQVLGQLPESIFIDLLFIWMIGVLITDSTGKSRIFGFVCLALAFGLKIYSYILPMFGTTLDEKYPALKMLLLTPFLWLLLESKKPK